MIHYNYGLRQILINLNFIKRAWQCCYALFFTYFMCGYFIPMNKSDFRFPMVAFLETQQDISHSHQYCRLHALG